MQAAVAAMQTLAPRLDESTVRRMADALLEMQNKGLESPEFALDALAAIAPHLAPSDADNLADILMPVIIKSPDYFSRRFAATALSAIVLRLDSVAVQRVANTIIEMTEKPTDLNTPEVVMSALAPRLDAQTSHRALNTLIELLDKAPVDRPLSSVGVALASLAPHVDRESARLAAEAFFSLTSRSLEKDTTIFEETALRELAPYLDASATLRYIDSLGRSISKSTDGTFINAAAITLEVLLSQLESVERGNAAARIAKHLLIAVKNNALWKQESFEIGPPGKEGVLIWEGSFSHIVLHINHLRDAVDLLNEPACVRGLRRAVLLRMDQLAFPRATVSAEIPLDVLFGDPMTQAVNFALWADWNTPQRFRTIWDAVESLQKNHPEIDLDHLDRPAPRGPDR